MFKTKRKFEKDDTIWENWFVSIKKEWSFFVGWIRKFPFNKRKSIVTLFFKRKWSIKSQKGMGMNIGKRLFIWDRDPRDQSDKGIRIEGGDGNLSDERSEKDESRDHIEAFSFIAFNFIFLS